MKQRKVFLAIPTLTGELRKETEATVQIMTMEAQSLDWDLYIHKIIGDSLIAHARNLSVSQFMKSDCTDYFALDADVAFGAGVFTRLMTHRVHFVAAVYRMKCDEVAFPMRWPGNMAPPVEARAELVEAEAVPFGCVRISRPGMQKVWDAAESEWFMSSHKGGPKCRLLFNTELKDNVFWGEDFYFCRKWRETGQKIWVDAEIPMHHVNPEGKIYSGKLADHVWADL